MKRSLLISLLFVVIFCLALTAYAINLSNEPTGDPHAVKGGQLNLHTLDVPKSFNAFVDSSVDAAGVFGLVYDTLLDLNYNTLEYEPLIAKAVETSSDKKEFTVRIDPRAKWADGKAIISEDVLYTFDVIMNPKNLTSVQRMFYSRFNRPQIVDKYTIKFIAKTVHYNNLVAVASFTVLPKHLFEGKDFNKSFSTSLPPGSGPYILSEVKEGRYYTLTRNKNYWADQLPSRRGTYNFGRIRYKVIRDDNMAFEAFKKGDFDILDRITGKRWATETGSERFRKNWLIKQKVYNYVPRNIGGVALNMRNPLFKDLNVRQALFYLFDRETIIKKLEYGEYKPLNSYWPSLYGSGPANPAVQYNPEKAKELLKEAGYTKLDKDGYLIDSKGNRLEFTISYGTNIYEKHLTLFANTCRQAGIKVNLELLSWATLIKKMDEYRFDAVVIFWQQALFGEPEQLWHSKHMDEAGGSNLSGYKNPEVDRLIDSTTVIFDIVKRNEIVKKIDSLIYRDVPYLLFWGSDCSRILYKNVFGMPKTVFPKYSNDIIKYWWFDSSKSKKYAEAVKKNKSLPAVPEKVYYDKLVK